MEWISVESRLPEFGAIIIAIDVNNPHPWNMEVVEFDGNKEGEFWTSCGGYKRFTHWMPLPEPPEK